MGLSAKFYETIRSSLFSGSMSQNQVNVLEAINDQCVVRKLSLQQIAYIMATPYHEVGADLSPTICEYRWADPKNFYSQTGAMSNHTRSTTIPYKNLFYYGRGLSQITWLDNYLKMGVKRGKDYAGNPSLVLDMNEGVWILVEGLTAGDFTGKKLSEYINESKCDFVGARYCYNGQDKAQVIAGYASNFLAALLIGSPSQLAKDVPIAQAPIAPPPVVNGSAAPKPSMWAWLGSLLTRKV